MGLAARGDLKGNVEVYQKTEGCWWLDCGLLGLSVVWGFVSIPGRDARGLHPPSLIISLFGCL